MQLTSYTHLGRDSYGAVFGDLVKDLRNEWGGRYPDLKGLLADPPADLESVAASVPGINLPQISFRPVIPNPSKIVCVGLNYRDHVAETGRPLAPYPLTFLRLPETQVGHLQPLVRPAVSKQLDYEGELVVIMGKRGRHIPSSRAFEHVAGYSIYNEASVRDWQKHSYTAGKNFTGTGALGPWMVTADEIPNPRALTLKTLVNGETVQQAQIAEMIFPIEELISYVSKFTELMPGDVIVSGTPSGVGGLRTPPVWLQPGDIVEVAISGIGVLRNSVTDEQVQERAP